MELIEIGCNLYYPDVQELRWDLGTGGCFSTVER